MTTRIVVTFARKSAPINWLRHAPREESHAPTLQGHVNIKGTINSINYAEDNTKKDKEDSFFNRLFR